MKLTSNVFECGVLVVHTHGVWWATKWGAKCMGSGII